MTLQETYLRNVYVTLVPAGIFAVVGIIMLIYGISLSRRTTMPSGLRDSWQRHIIPLLGQSTPDKLDADAMRSAEWQWLRMHSGSVIGGSIGTLVGVGGMAAAMLVAAHAPFGLPFSVIPLFFAPLYWGLLVGSAVGEVVVSRGRVNGTYDDGLADGEPSRRVADYRSPLLLLVVALPFMVFNTLTLILAPRFMAFPPTIAREYGIISPPRWIVAIYPCVALVALILAEISVWMRVKLAAAIRLREAALSRRLHTGVTRQFVGMTYSQAMFFSTFMGMAVIQLFSLALNGVGFAVCMGISLVLFAVSLGMIFLGSRGRLGGRLTGWPWGNRAAQAGAEAATGDGAV